MGPAPLFPVTGLQCVLSIIHRSQCERRAVSPVRGIGADTSVARARCTLQRRPCRVGRGRSAVILLWDKSCFVP